MQQRKQLAYRVLQEKVSISTAAREAGVSRQTAYVWVQRAREQGLEQLAEKSRAPHRRPVATPQAVVERVLEVKQQYPDWGAKKIVARLWPETVLGGGKPDGAEPNPVGAAVAVRTADRILARHDLVQRRKPVAKTWQRFERAHCNELWQMDFKGMGRGGPGYWPLSILDDHSRYCLAFTPVARQTGKEVLNVLWQVFGDVGLPQVMLTDNGSCFSGTWGFGISWLESQLWLLGVETRQGRPYHPQTQGKVERFHRTVEGSLKDRLRQPTPELAAPVYAQAVHVYNWERPHEALRMQVPGNVYVPSPRPRPARIPQHEIPEDAIKRKVLHNGDMHYRSGIYRISGGLAGEWIEIRELDAGPVAYFAGKPIGLLDAARARKEAAPPAKAEPAHQVPTEVEPGGGGANAQ